MIVKVDCCDKMRDAQEFGSLNDDPFCVIWVDVWAGDPVVRCSNKLLPIKYCPWCGEKIVDFKVEF